MERTLYDFLRMILNVNCSVSCSRSYGENTVRLSTYDMGREVFHVLGPIKRTLYDFLRMIWDAKCSVSCPRSHEENTVRLSTYDVGREVFCFMF